MSSHVVGFQDILVFGYASKLFDPPTDTDDDVSARLVPWNSCWVDRSVETHLSFYRFAPLLMLQQTIDALSVHIGVLASLIPSFLFTDLLSTGSTSVCCSILKPIWSQEEGANECAGAFNEAIMLSDQNAMRFSYAWVSFISYPPFFVVAIYREYALSTEEQHLEDECELERYRDMREDADEVTLFEGLFVLHHRWISM
jgi:hypothetical protein